MDPTLLKKRPTKSNPIITTSASTSTTKPHPTPPDPTVSPSSTIQNISNHFAKLYTYHKTKNPISHPHFIQEKGLNNSSALDSSCVTLTKSNSQHGRSRFHVRPAAAPPPDLASANEEEEERSNCTRTKFHEKDNKYYSVINVKKPHHTEVDVEKGQKFNEVKKKSSLAEAAAPAPKADENKQKKKTKEFYNEKDMKKASALMSKSLESQQFNQVPVMKRLSMNDGGGGAGGGRRKSFSCSQAELADFFSCNGVKVVAVDMPPFMQIHAVNCARKACDSLEKFTSKTLAFTLKKEFDGVYGPAWHCIVGTSFGSFVTHSVGGFMYFSMDHKLYILLFKTTVQRAD